MIKIDGGNKKCNVILESAKSPSRIKWNLQSPYCGKSIKGLVQIIKVVTGFGAHVISNLTRQIII